MCQALEVRRLWGLFFRLKPNYTIILAILKAQSATMKVALMAKFWYNTCSLSRFSLKIYLVTFGGFAL